MPRQLRSSTKPAKPTPYTKPPKALSPPPPSAPPGQTKKIPQPLESSALPFPNPEAFAAWLASSISLGHTSAMGCWLRLAKKACPTPDLTYDQALPVALAHGWIDGQRKALAGDPHYFIQRFTPRRAKSLWSKRNVGIVEKLIEDDKMEEQGMKEVQAAKDDGRWERAYSGGKDIQTPKDFEDLLKENRKAWRTWEGLGRGERFGMLMRLETLRTVEGRERKMGEFVGLLAKGRAA